MRLLHRRPFSTCDTESMRNGQTSHSAGCYYPHAHRLLQILRTLRMHFSHIQNERVWLIEEFKYLWTRHMQFRGSTIRHLLWLETNMLMMCRTFKALVCWWHNRAGLLFWASPLLNPDRFAMWSYKHITNGVRVQRHSWTISVGEHDVA